MTQVQTAVVAGLFYPAEGPALRREIDQLLASATTTNEARPHALIAPHAGYCYSGPIAANAYAAVAPWAEQIRRAVVLAPSHRVPLRGIATNSADVFQTPLGNIPVDRAAVDTLAELPGVLQIDAAFAEEHALEVQLPFLQSLLGEFSLVPLIVGDSRASRVSQVIEQLYRDDTLIVVSSDLSHYHDYSSCQQRDRATTALIETLQDERIGPHDACGAYPIRGLLKTAQHQGWQVHTLDLRNSGDTAGDKSRVVGYGAYGFY